jgi:hypothetical protein
MAAVLCKIGPILSLGALRTARLRFCPLCEADLNTRFPGLLKGILKHAEE